MMIFICIYCVLVFSIQNSLQLLSNSKDAKITDWPFFVSVFDSNKHLGGGTILNERWILTAASLVQNKSTYYVIAGSDQFGKGAKYSVDKVVIHREWQKGSKFRNDIALIHLKDGLKYSDKIQKGNLPPKDASYDQTEKATLVGFGVRADGKISQVLQKGTMPTLSNSECHANSYLYHKEDQICAVHYGMFGATPGDCGGPLLNRVDDKLYVIGIMSYREYTLDEWARPIYDASHPGYFTRVSRYVDWIQSVLHEKNHAS